MLYNLLNFNAFRDACHNASRDAGWWKLAERYSNSVFCDPDRLTVPTKLCLIHSEISEAYDGYMTGAFDEHLPHLPGAAVEFGDVLIRIADLAGYLEIDLGSAIVIVLQADHIELNDIGGVVKWNGKRYSSWDSAANSWTSGAMEAFRKGNRPDAIIPNLSGVAANLARVVILCDLIARKNDWDLPAVAEAKMDYNAYRPDHKPDARASEGGKVF